MELKEIKELINLINKSKLSKLKIKNGDFSITIDKEGAKTQILSQQPIAQSIVATPQEVAQKTQTEKNTEDGDTLNSPMVGTFYHAPSPKSSAFVKVGDTVKKGDPIGVIEAMKVMNEIEAEFDCKILEIVAKNEQPVEFDMPLFKVEKL